MDFRENVLTVEDIRRPTSPCRVSSAFSPTGAFFADAFEASCVLWGIWRRTERMNRPYSLK